MFSWIVWHFIQRYTIVRCISPSFLLLEATFVAPCMKYDNSTIIICRRFSIKSLYYFNYYFSDKTGESFSKRKQIANYIRYTSMIPTTSESGIPDSNLKDSPPTLCWTIEMHSPKRKKNRLAFSVWMVAPVDFILCMRHRQQHPANEQQKREQQTLVKFHWI